MFKKCPSDLNQNYLNVWIFGLALTECHFVGITFTYLDENFIIQTWSSRYDKDEQETYWILYGELFEGTLSNYSIILQMLVPVLMH